MTPLFHRSLALAVVIAWLIQFGQLGYVIMRWRSKRKTSGEAEKRAAGISALSSNISRK